MFGEQDKLAEVYPSSCCCCCRRSSRHLSAKLDEMVSRRGRKKRLFIIQEISNEHLQKKEQQLKARKSQRTQEFYTMHKPHTTLSMRNTHKQIQSISNKTATKFVNPKSRSDTNSINKFRINTATVLPLLLIALCLAIIWPEAGGGQLAFPAVAAQQEIKANLPTVIVRGFLNYRTTVDGTVLLFTPDAGVASSSTGGPKASSSVFVAPPAGASSMAHQPQPQPQQPMSSRPAAGQDWLIEPTSSFQAPAATMAPFESASDLWIPVQATPPLRLAQASQTAQFRQQQVPTQPAPTSAPQGASSSMSGSRSGAWPASAPEKEGAEEGEELKARRPSFLSSQAATSSDQTASGSQRAQAIQRAPDGPSTPSVQSDDIIIGGEQQANSAGPTKAPTSSNEPASARTARPKRPSLGFNGQAIRAGGQRPDRGPRPQTGNQNEAQTHNTIHGIRRPGLSASPVLSSSESDQQQQQQQAPTSPSRSSVAGAKLRNRFKRPPAVSSPPASPPPNSVPSATTAPTTTPSTSAALIQALAATTTMSPVLISNVSPLSGSFRLAEPNAGAHDPIVGSAPKLAPANTPRAADQKPSSAGAGAEESAQTGGSELTELRMGDQAALQVRLSDLFGQSSSSAAAAAAAVASSTEVTGGGQSAGFSTRPAVGSDEVLLAPPEAGTSQPAGEPSHLADRKLISRSGDQPPSPDMQQQHDSLHVISGGLSGELQQGQLGNAPLLSLDAFFQGDQPQPESSEHRAYHQAKQESSPTSAIKKNHNERLTGWLDHHQHNKHIPRPSKQQQHEAGHLSQQLAANLNSLSPSFASNLPNSPLLKPTPVLAATHQQPTSATLQQQQQPQELASNHNLTTFNNGTTTTTTTTTTLTTSMAANETLESLQMQTLTQTYSTVITSTRTRLVPLQVKSTTAVHTITENYVITKVLTAYQTMPVGEFILPEVHSTRSPFEMFSETPVAPASEDKSTRGGGSGEQPISAPSNFAASPAAIQPEMQEQPISLELAEQKSPTDWLHDFNNLSNNNQQQQQQQQNHLAALLEQQAQEQNLAGFGLGSEPLDQLASSLDPASLLNNGQIQLPDLNNPIVLAAAIQNPQLAAVILAAQQLQLKQRAAANKLAATNVQQQQLTLQPSYATSFSTQVRPSTYTVRDTMFTTRLVSFKDGRTVRTRTVSEPGSVIEQVLTTTVTETIPFTLTIRPTGILTLPAAGHLATVASPQQQQQAASSNNQATINNALIATQLAQLLSRRQHQVQPSGLAALQQLLASQQQQQQQQSPNLAQFNNQLNQQRANQQQQQQLTKQFQPNFQSLLQSLQQQQQQQTSNSSPSSTSSPSELQTSQQQQSGRNVQPAPDRTNPQPTPPLGPLPNQPFVTTITNLQVRTYTVHNAFQTHFRTITSTQLITSTIFPPGATRSPTMVG